MCVRAGPGSAGPDRQALGEGGIKHIPDFAVDWRSDVESSYHGSLSSGSGSDTGSSDSDLPSKPTKDLKGKAANSGAGTKTKGLSTPQVMHCFTVC